MWLWTKPTIYILVSNIQIYIFDYILCCTLRWRFDHASALIIYDKGRGCWLKSLPLTTYFLPSPWLTGLRYVFSCPRLYHIWIYVHGCSHLLQSMTIFITGDNHSVETVGCRFESWRWYIPKTLAMVFVDPCVNGNGLRGTRNSSAQPGYHIMVERPDHGTSTAYRGHYRGISQKWWKHYYFLSS